MAAPLRVLHLEDNPRDAELIQNKLDCEGCKIVWAADREAFEAALSREPFDVVVSDYNLPGYDGITAMKRAIATQPGTPVIIISGTIGEEEAVKCLHLGATDYLLKDHLGRLGTAVRRAVHEADAERKRKRTEQILVRREQSLRESEKRTSFALAAAAMGVWEIEFATNHLTWSATMAPVFGLAPHEAPTTTEEYFQLIHRDDRDHVKASVDRAIAGERDYAVEFRTIWPDGSTHWVQGRAQVSYEADGAPVRLLGIGIDITARKVLEERLEQAQRAEVRFSKQQLQAKDQFFSHVSHELRTPLAAIDWFTTNMSERLVGEVTAEQDEHLDTILNNVKQLERMIDDFLDVTRADTGKLSIASIQMAVNPIIGEALGTCQTRTVAAGVTLGSTISPDLPMVWMDPDRTRQVLINLIDNAVKFTPPLGLITVAVRVADDPDYVLVSVSDTGCGIAPENQDRVFERLFQESGGPETSRKGLGLGLYISKELVTLQGGRIWVESDTGQGATFSFTVPVFSFRRIFAPVLTERLLDAGTMVVIRVDPASGKETAAANMQRLRETRTVLEACMMRDQGDLVVPRIFGSESSPDPFFIVASTHQVGGEAIVRRVRQQLASAPVGRNARPPLVSMTVVDYPTPAECGLEHTMTNVVHRLTELVSPDARVGEASMSAAQ